MTPKLKLSGGSMNADPNGSLGNRMSDTEITDDMMGNLFDNINRQEALQGRTEFRSFYVHNDTNSAITGITIEISANPNVTRISIGLDPIGKGNGSTSGVATNISIDSTRPTNVNFFGEDEASSDGPYDTVILPVGILKAGEAVPIWLKRVTEKGSEQAIEFDITVTHDDLTLPSNSVKDGGAIGELLKIMITDSKNFTIEKARIGFSDIGDSE